MRKKHKGLCETCVHAAECTFPRNPDRPVMCCDEFEGELKSAQEENSAQESSDRAHAAASDSDPNGSIAVKGLCRTCSKRDTCTYPKPEGGVWHCDEYE